MHTTKVVSRNTVTGTHHILRFTDGRIVETWASSTSAPRCGSLA
jgi:hypothetical protein